MRILLADDHPMIRTALEVLLRDTEYTIVGTAGTGEATLREIDRLQPDILLLDLQMPGGSGMEVLRRIRTRKPAPKKAALKVQGMVLKNSDPAFLLDCLDRVRHGRAWIDPELTQRSKHLAETLAYGRHAPLAPRERELIGFVRKGLRNREIADQLGVTEGTVKVYLHAVFEKLGVSSRTELAIRAEEFLA